MTVNPNNIELSQKELLVATKAVGLTADRFFNWERPDRGIMPPSTAGKGNRRKYSIDDLVHLGLVTVLATRLPQLSIAVRMAGKLKKSVVDALVGQQFDNGPVYVIYEAGDWKVCTFAPGDDLFKFLQHNVYPRFAPVVLIHAGHFALSLAEGLNNVLAQRDGFEDWAAKMSSRNAAEGNVTT